MYFYAERIFSTKLRNCIINLVFQALVCRAAAPNHLIAEAFRYGRRLDPAEPSHGPG